MRALLWLVFAAWLSYLWYGVQHATIAASCAATRELPPNHRVVSADLDCASNTKARYLGLYTHRRVNAKASLQLLDLRDAPVLPLLRDGETVFAFPADTRLPRNADAGTALTVKLSASAPPEPAQLVAIVCQPPDAPRCRPIVVVSEKLVPLLVGGASLTIELAASRENGQTGAQETK